MILVTPSLTNQMERHPCLAQPEPMLLLRLHPGRSKRRWHWDPTAVTSPNVFRASPLEGRHRGVPAGDRTAGP